MGFVFTFNKRFGLKSFLCVLHLVCRTHRVVYKSHGDVFAVSPAPVQLWDFIIVSM